VTVGRQKELVVPAASIVVDPRPAQGMFRKRVDRYEAVPVDLRQRAGGEVWVADIDLRLGGIAVTVDGSSLER